MNTHDSIAARNAAIVAMARLRTPPEAIATRFGVSRWLVGNIISKARRADQSVPYYRQRPALRAPLRGISLPVDLAATLAERAAARNVEPAELGRRILRAVVEDDLVDAVLDDGRAP